MTSAVVITDEELTAFLDGEADADQRRRIETALAADARLADRVARLQAPIADIRAAFDRQLGAAPEMPELPDIQRAPTRRFVGFVPGLVAGLALALAFTVDFRPAKWAQWEEYAAAYQALYVTETLSVVDSEPSSRIAQLNRLGARFDLTLAPLVESDSITFVRGQMLGFDGDELAQLAFLTSEGVPIALCILRDNGGTARKMTTGTTHGIAAASWGRPGYGFLLLGGDDPDALGEMATELQALI